MPTTSTVASETPEATPAEILAYVSDVLGQLADMVRGAGDRRLEAAIRLLAVYSASGRIEPTSAD